MSDIPSPEQSLNVVGLIADTEQRSTRRLPRLIAAGVRLVWHAAPRELVINCVLHVLGSIAVAAQLLFGRTLLDRLQLLDSSSSLRDVSGPLTGLAISGAVAAISTYARTEQQRLMSELVARHATGQVIEVATAADLIAFDSPAFHNRLQRALTNAVARPAQMVNGILGIVGALVGLIGIAAALVVIEPWFVLALVVGYVPIWVATTRASRVAYRFSVAQTERDRRRDYLARTLTNRSDAAEVRGFGLSAYLRQRYDGLYQERIVDVRHLVRRRTRTGALGAFVAAALNAVALIVLIRFVISGRLSVASAGAVAGAVILFAGRLTTLAGSAGSLYESSLFIEDFTSFVDVIPQVAARRDLKPAPHGFDQLTVENISFRYPSRSEAVLDNVSLNIDRGQIIALVGENGSGKTTLAKLLGGLYVPETGTVRWDGTDTQTFDPDTMASSVGVIFQNYVRFMMTAAENIEIGDVHRPGSRSRVKEAAERANASAFIEELTNGYDTQLGTEYWGGQELSGGQWQRVALARAFYRDAPFLILDEPTAALDARSEADLFERIRSLYAGRTVLLISHRFSTVKSADRIYVLRQGRIVEQGTHTQLMTTNGLYAELFTLQTAAFS